MAAGERRRRRSVSIPTGLPIDGNGTRGPVAGPIATALTLTLALAACGGSGSGDDLATADATTTIEVDGSPEGPGSDGAEVGQSDDEADDEADAVIQVEAGGDDPGDETTAPADGGDPSGPTATQPDVEPETSLPDDDPEDDPATEGRYELETPTGSLTDLASGSSTELSDEVTSDYTLLWFWTPTTPSSGQEAPLVERFADTFAGSIDVVAIGSGGERADADAFLRSSGLSVTTLWAPSTDSAEHYGVERVPSTLLIDGAGTIIGRWTGLPQEAFRLAERIG